MTDTQIARISGAPRASTVHVFTDDGGIAFKVENEIFEESCQT